MVKDKKLKNSLIQLKETLKYSLSAPKTSLRLDLKPHDKTEEFIYSSKDTFATVNTLIYKQNEPIKYLENGVGDERNPLIMDIQEEAGV